jgi:hypothetical protein
MRISAMLVAVARLAAIFTLLAAATGLLSRTDHIILRNVVFIVGLFCAYWSFLLRRTPWIVLMLAVAAAFNPILRLHPGQTGWIVLDVIAAAVLAASFFFLQEPAARA